MAHFEDLKPSDGVKPLDTARLVPSQAEQVPGVAVRTDNSTAVAQREEALFGNGGFSFGQFNNPYACTDVLAYDPATKKVEAHKGGDHTSAVGAIDKQIDARFHSYGASRDFANSIQNELHHLRENLKEALVTDKPPYSVSVAKDADSFLNSNPDIAKGLTEDDRQAIRHGGAFRDNQTHRLVFFENYLEGHANVPTKFTDTHNLRGTVAHEVEHVNDDRHKEISQTDPRFDALYKAGIARLTADSSHPKLLDYYAIDDPKGYGKSEAFAELSAINVTGETSRKEYSVAQVKGYFKELAQYVHDQMEADKW